MRELFLKRRQDFHNRCLNYLKYVLNDHFVLVLLFLVGFLLYQYSQLLEHFPSNSLGISLVLTLLVLGMLPLGSIATFLEAADQVFLLAKEEELMSWIRRAANHTFILWGLLQVAVLLILYPIFVVLGWSIVTFSLLVLALLAVKYVLIQLKVKKFISDGRLDWREVIAAEQRRQQSILKFFALFTTVKGISSFVKRRPYLDKVTRLVTKRRSQTWHNLYLRAFLRSGDYLGLTLRLVLLGLLALFFVNLDWLAVGLAFLFTYLLAFQLLALYRHYDYQYLTELFPLGNRLKKANLHVFLRRLIYLVALVQIACAGNLKKAALLLFLNVILVELYLRSKVKKMID